MYCAEFLEANGDWLAERLAAIPGTPYLLFDCPGQAELFTHHAAYARLVSYLGRTLSLRLAAVHLVDSHYCADPAKFIAAALMSLTAMMRLELPHINVLSKLDLARAYGAPSFSLDFYTELQDMTRLAGTIGDHAAARDAPWRVEKRPPSPPGDGVLREDEDKSDCGGDRSCGADDKGEVDIAAVAAAVSAASAPRAPDAVARASDARRRAFATRHRRLHAALAEVIEDYSMLSYVPISVREPESLVRLIKIVDKANGFVPMAPVGGGSSGSSDLLSGAPSEAEFERLGRFEERYFPRTGGDNGGSEEEEDEVGGGVADAGSGDDDDDDGEPARVGLSGGEQRA